MTNRLSRAVKFFGAALLPVSASASFNSFGNSPLCSNWDCVLWLGALIGILGIPISIVMLWGVALIARRRRTNAIRKWWVIINGVIAYAITIVVLLRGSSRDVTSVYVYLAYAVLFAMVSVVVDHRSARVSD